MPPKDLAEFAARFEVYAEEQFDAAIDRHSASGVLDRSAEASLNDYRAFQQGPGRP